MHQLSIALTPRVIGMILAVLLVLLLLTVLFLVHVHLGGTPIIVQSTESILD